MTTETFPSPPPSHSRIAPAFWRAGNVVLGLALIAQLAWIMVPRLAQDPDLRPLLETGCRHLGWRLPPFRDLGRIKVVDRGLYPIETPEEGLEFYLAMVNQALFPQPFPHLRLTLTALDGTPIGQRVFRPDTYLPPSHPLQMPIQKTVFVRLRLAPPDRPVGGFQFEFLP